jgi:hypothetical protein
MPATLANISSFAPMTEINNDTFCLNVVLR